MKRIACYVAVAFLAFFFPWWTFFLAATLYIFFFHAYELLAITLLVDALFGDAHAGGWYVYTAGTALLLIASSIIKPRLINYS